MTYQLSMLPLSMLTRLFLMGPSPTHIVASCFGYTEMELQLGISQEPVPHIPFQLSQALTFSLLSQELWPVSCQHRTQQGPSSSGTTLPVGSAACEGKMHGLRTKLKFSLYSLAQCEDCLVDLRASRFFATGRAASSYFSLLTLNSCRMGQ